MKDQLLDQVFKIPYNTLKNNGKSYSKNSIGDYTIDKWLISSSCTFFTMNILDENSSFNQNENIKQIPLEFKEKKIMNSYQYEKNIFIIFFANMCKF